MSETTIGHESAEESAGGAMPSDERFVAMPVGRSRGSMFEPDVVPVPAGGDLTPAARHSVRATGP